MSHVFDSGQLASSVIEVIDRRDVAASPARDRNFVLSEYWQWVSGSLTTVTLTTVLVDVGIPAGHRYVIRVMTTSLRRVGVTHSFAPRRYDS
jgi:hypothetical protein